MTLPEPFVTIIALGFILLSLIIIVIAIVGCYTLFNRWFHYIQKKDNTDEAEIINDAYTQAFGIIEDARKEALETIQQANKKAQHALLQTKGFTEQEKSEWTAALEDALQSFEQSFRRNSEDMMTSYHDMVMESKSKNHGLLQKLSKRIEQDLLEETKQLESFLETETDKYEKQYLDRTMQSEQSIERRIDQRFAEIDHQVEAYKQRRLEEINESILVIITTVFKDLFNQTLTTKEHEDLIFAALNQAIASEGLTNSNETT